MTTRYRPFESAPLPDDLTAAVAVAIWKEAHAIDPVPDFLLSPGELHGMAPRLSGHEGRAMLKRARRRAVTPGELRLAQ